MEAHAPEVTHEAERIARGPIVWVSLWVLIFSAVLCAIAFGLFQIRRSAIASSVQPRWTRPGLAVSNVRTDLFHYQPGSGDVEKERQRRDLDRFRWIDRERGLVAIPIDTAIELELSEQAR